MTAMKRRLCMTVMIQTCAGNVNMRIGDKLAEGLLYVLSAKGAQFNASLGQRPRIHQTQTNAPALKARFNPTWLLNPKHNAHRNQRRACEATRGIPPERC
jgi:hypothetical protein